VVHSAHVPEPPLIVIEDVKKKIDRIEEVIITISPPLGKINGENTPNIF
jgi:hypothetical protein